MTIERFILAVSSIFSAVSFIYVPKKDIRKAVLAFLAFQTITWIFALILTEIGVVEYPVREFVKATRANFLPQYLIYPAIFTWYVLLFSYIRNRWLKVLHFLIFVFIPVIFVLFIAMYTRLEHFTHFSFIKQFLHVFINFAVTYVLCHLYVWWFFRKKEL